MTELAQNFDNTQTARKENRAVNALLMSFGAMEIDFAFGMQMWGQYNNELALLESGVPFAELGISKRREAQQPAIFTPVGPSYELINDRGLLRNERLTKTGSIALMRLEGVMTASGQMSTRGVQALADDLRAAYANSNIGGIILEINSGGGQGIAKDMLVSVLSERNKPVVSFAHFAASAAYGTAAATDEIISASMDSSFGSIGAVVTIDKEMLEEMKTNLMSFYGDNAPLKNKEIRSAIDGNFDPIKAAANKYTDSFQSQISKLRPLTGDKKFQRETLSGDMFTAKEARTRGLIDGIGNMSLALARADVWIKKYQKLKK